ncbi:hypothetical protein [Comamonas thiooxydans]|uniref:hypothetical protein n=1 Tax=Comamonas thiooxydans TaxID=363952 RepID=UPI001CCD9E3E|nr:hypothetical protein [Comamonas thiooxydans]UBQ44584.1 hypothetical protein LCH15_26205 [Comamonas thiooxydans]
MELCTTIPPRNDGTVTVSFPLRGGKIKLYVFTGEPLACEVEDEGHIAKMQASGNFMSREAYEKEIDFLRQAAERAARLKAAGQLEAAQQSAALAAGAFVPGLGPGAGSPGADEEDEAEETSQQNANALPQEAGTRPTGRVNRAAKG